MKTIHILLILCLATLSTRGQEETNIEEILTLDDNNSEDGANYENILQLIAHPLNLNNATAEELNLMQLLSHNQILSFIKHREENGKLISIHELQAVEGFDADIVRRLAPYVDVKAPSEVIDRSLPKRIASEGQNYVMFLTSRTLEKKKGFASGGNLDQKFQGTPERLVMRYRSYRPGDFSIGITSEKDEGEKWKWNSAGRQFGFDYLSFHLQLQNKGKLRNFIAGDFQCQFGQGLIWGGALGFGKGSETINTSRKGNIGIVPYTSAYEAGSLRGFATTLALPRHIKLTLLYSSTKRDATTEDNESEPTISATQTTGLHRNSRELEKRRQMNETVYGGVMQYQHRQLEIGFSLQRVSYNATLQRAPQPYNGFMFQGKQNTNAGLFLNYNFHNVSFFSEYASSIGSGKGYVLGTLINLSKKFEISLLHRNYDKDFHSFYSNGFSENTLPQNERGIYWGWKYKLNRRFTYLGYFDLFEFPWLKFRTYAPSKGSEWLMRFSWTPSRSAHFFIQARQETKSRNSSEIQNAYVLNRISKRNYWINFDYTLNTSLKMKTRIQFSNFRNGGKKSEGFLVLQDISFTIRKLKCTGRYALFDTDDFDNRQYVYENDVWMSYSLPAYYGKGIRKYILLQYKVNKKLTFWMRYSHTRYLDREVIGSGADEIDGNKRNDIKFETRFTF